MSQAAAILERTLASLDLEVSGEDRFLADPGPGEHRLYGGLVAAQCVVAAGRTVDEGRKLHSLHAYFLRPGAPAEPIELAVTKMRDGGSYSTRQVVAHQGGEAIFQALASFARDESGPSSQSISMPAAPDPEGLPDRELERAERYREAYGIEMPIHQLAVEVRLCDASVVEPGSSREPLQANWHPGCGQAR